MCFAIPALGLAAAQTFSMGLGVIGTAVSAMGAIQQQQAQNAQMQYQASVAEANAKIANNQAKIAQDTAQDEANKKRLETAQVIGTQRAKMSGSGAVVDTGSFLDVTLDTAERGELDAQSILEQGDRQAWYYRNQATIYGSQASMYRSAGSQSPWLSVTSNLLSGAANIGSSYYKMAQGQGYGWNPTSSAWDAKNYNAWKY